ncbi:MAG: hypothetical protein ACRCW9_08130, partial [Cetobacterium sp.]
MGYCQDRDFENWLDAEFSAENECTKKDCRGCISYYKCNHVEDTTVEQEYYMVVASGLYLM